MTRESPPREDSAASGPSPAAAGTTRALSPTSAEAGIAAVAEAVRGGRATAVDIARAALARIRERDRQVNAFTDLLEERALGEAAEVDAAVRAGRDPGPLAGVPFGVKNLFDVAGLVTRAGSRIHRDRLPAARDATAVAALRRAGAVLVGALNMEEYAYGFSTENAHDGPTRNPHDPARIAGGSSGGSAAAVAAGMVPLALGTDTNGSIRVPAALCGVFGLKPTYGRLGRTGIAFLATSLDHVGPFARSVHDLALAYDALQGRDPADPACAQRPPEPVLPSRDAGIDGLRIAVAGGHFAGQAEPEALAVVARAATALGATRTVVLPEAHRARAAAMLITASEGAALHLPDLRRRPRDFDPVVRDRLLAAALLPAGLYVLAQRFRAWYRARVAEVFREVDVIVAPATPYAAPEIGAPRTRRVAGAEVVTRSHLGVFTQPISFIGLPVLAAPVAHAGPLPLGVQLIAAPWNECALFRAAALLEAQGVSVSSPAPA